MAEERTDERWVSRNLVNLLIREMKKYKASVFAHGQVLTAENARPWKNGKLYFARA